MHKITTRKNHTNNLWYYSSIKKRNNLNLTHEMQRNNLNLTHEMQRILGKICSLRREILEIRDGKKNFCNF